MNTNEIYEYFNIRERLDTMYRKWKRAIEKDKAFSLTDDEIFELFVDLIKEYQKEYNENFK